VASRLTRWALLTLVAVGASMVALLPPGVSPVLLFSSDPPTYPTNGLAAAVRINRELLDGSQWELNHLRVAERLASYRSGSRPLVVVHTGTDSVWEERALTREAEALWRSIPHHPDAPRSLLVVDPNLLPEKRPYHDRRLCEARLIPYQRWNGSAGSAIRSGAGGCLLATEFGAPGRGLDDWLATIGNFYIPGAIPRAAAPIRPVVPGTDLWFERDHLDGEPLPWWSSTLITACSAGRGRYCVEALGFGPGGLDSLEHTPRAFYSSRIFAALPAALLADLGAEWFGTLWRSDDPLPVAYEKVSGRPFADWATGYVQKRVGRLEEDNALSLAGWLGWGVWMVLLVGWLAVRIREQSAR